MLSWYAIPFAAPPVGDLRWRAPQPAASWKTPIAASKTAAPCLQTGPESPFRARAESEDCLYLDVHAPAGKGPYPVMVWIHGGAFTTGDASTYAEAGPLVSRGVIVVAIHYRLGAMGFLAHPALRDSNGSAGDYGIMDQQAALKWVRANISRFGGDARFPHVARAAISRVARDPVVVDAHHGVIGEETLEARPDFREALRITARDDPVVPFDRCGERGGGNV